MSNLEFSPETATRASFAPSQFTCELRAGGRGAAWVDLGGELDLASARRFREVLEQGSEGARLVIVDLRGLTFMDSSGVHAIIQADLAARRAGRRMAFVRGPAQIERLFALVGLSDRLEVIDPEPGFVSSGALAALVCSELG